LWPHHNTACTWCNNQHKPILKSASSLTACWVTKRTNLFTCRNFFGLDLMQILVKVHKLKGVTLCHNMQPGSRGHSDFLPKGKQSEHYASADVKGNCNHTSKVFFKQSYYSHILWGQGSSFILVANKISYYAVSTKYMEYVCYWKRTIINNNM
jgi:hypothetical protein